MRGLTVILLLLSISAYGQFGGYSSLNAPFGARNAALGGKVTSLSDGDIMQFVHNPSLLDSVAPSAIAINFSPYFAGIYSFSGAYAGTFGPLGKLAIGMTYLNYGDFRETAENGDELGSFQAQDYVLVIGKSHQLNPFSIGANLKFAYAGVDGFGSSLLLMDLGGIYRSPGQSDFSIGLVFKNMGFVLRDFTGSSTSAVPFDVQMSTSIKPEHMPFRFSISGHSLVQNDLYVGVKENGSQSRAVEVADKIFRRVNVGAELILHRNIQFLFGYSHIVRQELKISENGYGAGFSFGALVRIKNIGIRYAHATYHAAGGTDFITIQTELNSFKKILK